MNASLHTPTATSAAAPRVLVASHAASRAPLLATLRCFDARIAFVDDCEQALRHVLASDLELLLLDADLPGMTALEACALIRQQDERLPIIALSSAPLAADDRVDGFTAVLRTPLDLDQAGRLLQPYLRARTQPADAGDATLADALTALRDAFVAGLEPRYLAEMRGQLANGEREPLRRTAHRLAGSAGCHQLRPLADAASQLERALLATPERDAADIHELFDQLLAAVATLGQSTEHAA